MPRENAYTRFLRDPDADARRAELEAFIGRNPAPFLKMYDRLRASPARPGFGAMLSFVAMAFFLGPCWFFYRQMWAWAWALIALIVVLGLLPFSFPRNVGVILGVVLATQGRYAYLTYAFGRIEKLRAGAARADPQVLARAGGVSPVAGWISSIVYVVLSALAVAAILAVTSAHPELPPPV